MSAQARTGESSDGGGPALRIAVYTIAQNERKHVERFLESAREADLIVVSDTGSTDGTMEALEAGGAIVHRISIRPWRFDDARNASLAVVPGDIDVCVSIDLDEVLNPGWAEALRREWVPGTTRGRYQYAYSHLDDGRPGVEYWADKIHARHGYRWRHACHEALYPDRLIESGVRLRGLRVDHWPDRTKSRGGYLPLLQLSVLEDPREPRHAFYYARDLYHFGRLVEAETELRRYLELPGANWNAERAEAMRMIAGCRRQLGDAEGAVDWLRRAAGSDPESRDGWVQLAEQLCRIENWPGAWEAINTALAIRLGPRSVVNDPKNAGSHPHDLASFCAFRMGLTQAALAQARLAASLSPEDARLAANVETLASLVGTDRD